MKTMGKWLLAMGFAGAAGAADLTLIENGQPRCQIVLKAEAGAVEKFAAKELQEHLKLMSGAEVAVAAEKPADAAIVAILLGTGPEAQKAFGLAVGATPVYDAFSLKADGNTLAIAGDTERGVLYGVYSLLESLGCRWWTPTESTIPKLATVKVPAGARREQPRLEYRDMMYQEGWSAAGKLWHVRNKCNGFAWSDPPAEYGGRYKFHGNLVHSYMNLIKLSGQPLTEEMKALVNGKRTTDQPCLTSPATFQAMVAGVLKAFKDMPDARFVEVGQMDNRNYCRCPECQKLIDAEGPSGPVIDFANRVADAVAKARPGSAICTAAYEWSRQPPKTIKPRDNVYITFCSIECDFAHPLATAPGEVNAALRQDMQAWGKIAKRIYVWDYTTNFRAFLAPFPNVDVLVPNVKFFADNAAAGVFEQGAHTGAGSDFVELKMWLLAKALWNPDANAKALVKEFCDGYYGPASPAIQEYLDVMHAPARTQDFTMRIYRLMDAPYHAPEVIAAAEAALRQAEAAAKGNADLERRVRHAHVPVWYMLAKRGPGSPTWKATEAKAGKLDFGALAAGFAQSVKEYGINAVADHEDAKPFVEWLQDYAKLVKEKGGAPVPAELAGKDPATYRVIQACQMDDRGSGYERADGASDGWCIKQPSNGWHIRSVFAAGEHFVPGQRYKFCMRVRGKPEADAGSKSAWNYGISSGAGKEAKYPVRGNVSADKMTGKWQVVEAGEWTPANGDSFYIATDPKVLKAVYLDCMWVEKVSPAP